MSVSVCFCVSPYTTQLNVHTQFVEWAREYGLHDEELFEPRSLVEGTDVAAVINTIHTLAEKCVAKGYDGPKLTPTDAIDFTKVCVYVYCVLCA